MLRIDKNACANCISNVETVTGDANVSHYMVVFDKGRYSWFAVIKCRGCCGIPTIRECVVIADDDERLYKELYGIVPGNDESFRKDIEKKKGAIVRRHCEMSKECPYYDLHFLK